MEAALRNSPDISVVVPAFNEEELIERSIMRFLDSLSAQRRSFELIVVNDGSRDRTGALLDRLAADEPRLRVIHFARNFGQTAAMMAGFLAARGEAVVALDADGQNEPDEVEKLVDRLDDGFDVVSGWRRDRKDSWLRTRVSRVANWIIGKITGVKLHDYGCTLKAYRAHVVRDARLFGEMHRFIPVFTTMHGARIDEMVVRHHPRTAGQSKYGYGRVMRVALDMALVRMLQRYSTKPLHFFGKITQYAWLGTLACFGFAGLQAIYSADPWKAFWGKAPLVGVILFVLGFIAIMSGLVAELVMRAGYEPVGGQYWEVARATNFDANAEATQPRTASIERLVPSAPLRERSPTSIS
ncbi:MAG: glycosyltransferase family 2 protein [Phycisphaerales bacterium]|nr:glycosyltransferase family 2 protein [Phycisphaerales bacterium]